MNKVGKVAWAMIIPAIIYACGSNSEKPKFWEDFLVNIDSLSKNKDISHVLSENIHRAENFNYRLVDVYKLFSLKRPLG